jgi:hypothetical protein
MLTLACVTMQAAGLHTLDLPSVDPLASHLTVPDKAYANMVAPVSSGGPNVYACAAPKFTVPPSDNVLPSPPPGFA